MRFFSPRNITNLTVAVESILANKMRAFLTALGIIFGVAAVIAMLAIGQGAKLEILEQIKLVGANNVVIKPVFEQKEESEEKENKSAKGNEIKKYSPGLTLEDVKAVQNIVPGLENIAPEIVIDANFIYGEREKKGKLVGTTPDYFSITNFKLIEGALFSEKNLSTGDQVCIIGKGIKTKFFTQDNPIGKYIKCGGTWMKIIGILEEKRISDNAISNLGIRDYNLDIYIPLKTMLVRFANRSKVTRAKLESIDDDEMSSASGSGSPSKNYHQLDRVIVKVKNTDHVKTTVDVIGRMMKRRHNDNMDFEISVPEQLLKQQQRTKDIFNIVLGFIAGISLLVGGIGIMNIMLASVLERIKEIGIRLSMGATPVDIVQQFLFEAILISISGGIIGVIVGVVLSYLIPNFFDIKTEITFWSIAISFSVAALTGLVFGISPARNAARQDPIKSLRHE